MRHRVDDFSHGWQPDYISSAITQLIICRSVCTSLQHPWIMYPTNKSWKEHLKSHTIWSHHSMNKGLRFFSSWLKVKSIKRTHHMFLFIIFYWTFILSYLFTCQPEKNRNFREHGHDKKKNNNEKHFSVDRKLLDKHPKKKRTSVHEVILSAGKLHFWSRGSQ